jgi:hypothetical protein
MQYQTVQITDNKPAVVNTYRGLSSIVNCSVTSVTPEVQVSPCDITTFIRVFMLSLTCIATQSQVIRHALYNKFPLATTTTTLPPTTVHVSSDPCQDNIDDCSAYGSDVCTAYAPWAKINCRRHCKFCQRKKYSNYLLMTVVCFSGFKNESRS